jgi:transposase-like protein
MLVITLDKEASRQYVRVQGLAQEDRMNLSEIAKHRSLSTEEKCIAYLEKMRWPEGVHCPACGNISISHFQTKGKSGKVRNLYQCLGKGCRYQFSPTTGTIFHDSHLPLNKWFRAIALLSDAEKPMSTNQLRLALGVQYKTAAHLAGRIRLAIENGTIDLAAVSTRHSPTPAFASKDASQPRPSDRAQLSGKENAAGQPSARGLRIPFSMTQRRAETAALLNQIATPPGRESVSGTAVDNMLSMFVSVAQMSVRPPLFFVKYIKDKVFT